MTDLTVQFAGPVRVAITMLPAEPSRAGAWITARTPDGIITKGQHMAYNLPDAMQIAVAVSYTDASGNPAQVDGVVAWSSSDATIATVASTGPTSALVAAGTLGTAQITATADADLGAGVVSLLTPFDVTIVAGQAVAGTISPVGDPQPIP